MKYLKLFDDHSDYLDYKSDAEQFIMPNVSYCKLEDEVHYNKFSDERMIATFNVTTTSEPIYILGSYSLSDISKIEIDDVELSPISYTYQFDTTGTHTVKYTRANDSVTTAMFDDMTSLVSVWLPDWVTTVWLRGCTSLTSVHMQNGVTTVDSYGFYNCTSLISLTLPNSITTIGNNAFEGCTSLTSIEIPNKVTQIQEKTFNGCTSLETVTLSQGITSIGDYAFSNCSSLEGITLPDGLTTIGHHAFYGCSGMTTGVEIPSTVTTIYDYAFNASIPSVTVYAAIPPTLVIDDTAINFIAYVFGEGRTTVFLPTINYPIYVPSSLVETYKATGKWAAYKNRIQAII